MEDLKRLIRIIYKRKQRQYPLLEFKNINEKSSKENIYYRYIKNKIVNNDEDAAKLLYNAKGDDDRYRMLKSRLKQKLLNHVFFLDFTDNNQKASNQYEQECIQQLHQAKMLIFTGEYKIAKGLILKALTTAERCEFTKYMVNALEDLVKVYSDNCQPHLFDDIVKRLKKARQKFLREEEARVHFYFIKMMVIKSVNSRKKNLDKAAKSIAELEKLFVETKSYNIFEYIFELTLLHKELTGDYQGIITLLKEVEKGKYKGKALNKYRMEGTKIVLSKAFAYLKACDLDKGIAYTEKSLDLFEPYTDDWYKLMDTYFRLAVFNKKYDTAQEVIDTIFDNKLFEKLEAEEKDKWKLYNMYLKLMQSGNLIVKSNSLVRMLEKMPEYDKNKEGFHAAVLILQFIFFVGMDRLDEIEKRRDMLKKFMANHFKENFSYRSRTIYKLINIVVENKMDLKAIQFKSRYLTKKLKENKIVGNVYTELEIVPYEHLWETIINLLKYNERSF